jgi:hypothetical protein
MPTEKKDTPKTQLEKFIEAAHKLECDVTEEEFDEALRDIIKIDKGKDG